MPIDASFTPVLPANVALLQPGQNFEAFCIANGERPKFSAPEVPAVGSTFGTKRTYFHHEPKPNERVPLGTAVTVLGYFVENGWLHLAVVSEGDTRVIYITGNELT